ncbi:MULTISPECIES: mycofactocin precursor MftA [unclassified Streptomyces]
MNEFDPTITTTEARPATETAAADEPVIEPVIEADELVEEVSIDGMCGVY